MVRGAQSKQKQRSQSVASEILSERERSKLAASQKLAQEIFAYREARGINQTQLAELAHVSVMTISRAERGFSISLRNRHKLNAALSSNVTGDTLAGFSNTQKIPGRPQC